MNKAIIENIKKLGLNEYEAKAYLYLLKESPLNGYALSKISGIPRSRIYEVISNLIEKQLVFEECGEKSSLYYPIKPEEFVEKFKNDFNKVINNVSTFTSHIYNENKEQNNLHVIKKRDHIIEFVIRMINKAEKNISLFIWEEEIQLLKNALDSCLERGVTIKGIYFGTTNPYEELVVHRRLKRYLAEKKERFMIVAIDGKEVVSGVVSRGEDSQVTWTNDFGFVEMSEEYIVHDLLVNLYSYKLQGDTKKEFEDFADKIRMEYFGIEKEEFDKFKIE